MVQSIESNGADDTVNASDPGDFPFGEELIIAALDALLETLTPGRHAPPQILPSTPDPRPVISVEADLLHDAVVSLCLPAFKGGDKGAASPIKQRLARQKVPHLTLILSSDSLRLRNEAHHTAVEVELPIKAATVDLPTKGIAVSVPYHFISGLYGSRGCGLKRAIVQLSYDAQTGTLHLVEGSTCLAITVQELPEPPRPLAEEAIDAKRVDFAACEYAKALKRLKGITSDQHDTTSRTKFWLEEGRVLVAGHQQPAEYLSSELIGLKVCLSPGQFPTVLSLLARLGRKQSTMRSHQNLFLLSNEALTVMFRVV